jgi:hypothetical protein
MTHGCRINNWIKTNVSGAEKFKGLHNKRGLHSNIAIISDKIKEKVEHTVFLNKEAQKTKPQDKDKETKMIIDV